MKFNDFQKSANKTYYFAGETEREELLYLALATNAEAGELADEIKKMMRDDSGKLTKKREIKIKKEMGDTLFYMSILAKKLGFDFSEAADAELEKLKKMIYNWEIETGLKFTPELFKKHKRNKNK